ncbi:MAG TPA: antibiotic biosynthesis monooxygenase [Pseudonocardiaceae bacterium]|nr:antibiotic biosynthesis monooxygenase [Pseudonocardiaceae bacterium]
MSDVLEVARLDVLPDRTAEFEAAFAEARAIISASPGFVDLELRRCVEHAGRYLLLVRWATLADHTVGFRQGPDYPRWKALLHHFYDPFPEVEHYVGLA